MTTRADSLARSTIAGIACRTLAAVAALALATTFADAQQPAPKSAPAAKSAPQPKQSADAPAASSGDTGLRQRVEQLEEQFVDLQVTMGTLESLARGGGSGGSGTAPRSNSPMSGGDETRMAAMEQQIRALQGQVEQLTQQLRAQGGRPPASAVGSAAQPPGPGFGSTTVSTDRDPIGQIIATPQPPQVPPQVGTMASSTATPTPAFPQATASDASAKQLYEAAYGQLLQQDYAAAEAAFEEFLKRFPNDQLAGNAQYWLGETFFVRGQFKAAANAFLKGYQTYGRSVKAPDSLLKLAMSLDRLGQKDAACSSYSELTVKFPNAPVNVKSRADSERRRLGCV